MIPLARLEQGDLGRFRDLYAHPVENLGLSNKLQNLLIEVDVQLPVVRVPNDQRRLARLIFLCRGGDGDELCWP